MPNILTDADKALENCRLYAARHRSEEWAKAILRFCAEAGVTGSPLRALPAQVEQEAEPVAWRYSVQPQVLGPAVWAFSETKDVEDAQPLYASPTPAAPAAPAGMAVPREPTQAEVSAVRMTSPSFITEAQARSVARAVLAASPSAQAAPARGAMEWISVEDRMPEPGTDCLVWVTALGVGKGFAKVDCWDEQHEAPVSWSSATIPVGLGWNDSDYEDVTHWMPLPPAPGIGTTAPARGAMTEDTARLDWLDANHSKVEPIPYHGGARGPYRYSVRQWADGEPCGWWNFRTLREAIDAARGIGTTAPAGGEG